MGRRRRKSVRAVKARTGNKPQESQVGKPQQKTAAAPLNILELHQARSAETRMPPAFLESIDAGFPAFTPTRGNLALQVSAFADPKSTAATAPDPEPEQATTPEPEPEPEAAPEAPEDSQHDDRPEVLDYVIRYLGTPNSEVVVSAIRELVANHANDIDAANDEPRARKPAAVEPEAVELPLIARREDRWAELRELSEDMPAAPEDIALTDEAAEEADDAALEDPAPEPAPEPLAPIQRIAERHAQRARQELQIQPEIIPPTHLRSDWDDPARHEMSRSGKLMWNAGIFGFLLAIPVFLLGTSPFSAKDTAKHYLALGGCSVGNTLALNPARQGAPGYHAILDEDGDGLACEAARPRTTTAAGGSRFIRP